MPKRSRKNKSKKQRLYNMKGCSKTGRSTKTKTGTKSKGRSRNLRGGSHGCGSNICPIPAYSWKQMQQRGGTCNTCSSSMFKGGSFYKPAAPMPGPFIGQAWSPSIKGWPGVDGVSNNRNYIENNLYNAGDPQTMMKLGGSKSKRRRRSKGKRGGGIIPQDLVNLGSDVSFNFKSAYNALNGYTAPISPLPYKDQLSSSISANKLII